MGVTLQRYTGISYYGNTWLIFNDKGVKDNADYYINNVLKPFHTKDVPRMFPGRGKEMMFHQDSTSSHTTKTTIDFLNKRKVKSITPAEWMSKRNDATHPYGIWGILKGRLQKRKIYIIT